MPCSIRPKSGAKKDELKGLARITQDKAQAVALATFKDSSKATVKEAELEAEHEGPSRPRCLGSGTQI
jgi:hypothetical protein